MAEIKYARDFGYPPASPHWLIWGGSRFEPIEHSSRESAEQEAAEIARKRPGEPVHILAVVSTISTSDEVVGQRFDPSRAPAPDPVPEFAEVDDPPAPPQPAEEEPI